MNSSSSVSLLLVACGLIGAAAAQGADSQGAQVSVTPFSAAAQQGASDGLAASSDRQAAQPAASTAGAANAAEGPATQPVEGQAAARSSTATSASAATGKVMPRGPLEQSDARDPLAAAVIDDAQLGKARGGADPGPDPLNLTQSNANSTGTVGYNVATDLSTGSNSISSGSLSNSSGIPILIQNTGNNVLIQNSTILNLQLESPK